MKRVLAFLLIALTTSVLAQTNTSTQNTTAGTTTSTTGLIDQLQQQ